MWGRDGKADGERLIEDGLCTYGLSSAGPPLGARRCSALSAVRALSGIQRRREGAVNAVKACLGLAEAVVFIYA